MKTELEYFDGLDNRKHIIQMLERLGSNERRAKFLESLIPHSLKGFAEAPMKVQGNSDAVGAYFMLVGICNELGVSINYAAQKLEKVIRKS